MTLSHYRTVNRLMAVQYVTLKEGSNANSLKFVPMKYSIFQHLLKFIGIE